MSITRSTHRTTIAGLVCALLVAAAPAAAQPADMHASVAQGMADARQQPQDLRAPDNIVDSTVRSAVPGPPTWPVDPQPIGHTRSVHAVSSGDDGIGWLTIALGLTGSLLAIGGIVAIAVHARRLGRVHISA